MVLILNYKNQIFKKFVRVRPKFVHEMRGDVYM